MGYKLIKKNSERGVQTDSKYFLKGGIRTDSKYFLIGGCEQWDINILIIFHCGWSLRGGTNGGI